MPTMAKAFIDVTIEYAAIIIAVINFLYPSYFYILI